MKSIKKYLVALLSTVLMLTSLSVAPALADETPLGNDDFNILVNKELNSKDLTLELKIKLEDKDPTTPKVVSDLSQVIQEEGKENKKLDLVEDKTDEYKMVVSENGEIELELNYSKEVKAAEGETEAINREEKHNFKVNVTEIEEPKAAEPKAEEKINKADSINSSDNKIVKNEKLSQVRGGAQLFSSGTMVGNDYVIVEGNLKLTIKGYDPSVGMHPTKEVYDIQIEADFNGNTTDEKTVEIDLGQGMKYDSYEVLGAVNNSKGEKLMDSSYSGLFVSSVSPDRHPIYDSVTGKLTYTVAPTTTKILLAKTKVKTDFAMFHKEDVYANVLNAKTSIGGVAADEINTDIKTTGTWRSGIYEESPTVLNRVEGDTEPVRYGYNVQHLDYIENGQFSGYFKKVVYTYYYPVGAKYEHFEFDPATINSKMQIINVTADDSQGKLVIETKDEFRPNGGNSAKMHIYLDTSEMAAGTYNTLGKEHSIELTTFDDDVYTVTKSTNNRKIIVKKLSDIPDKLEITPGTVKFPSNPEEGYVGMYGLFSIKNSNETVKKNRYFHYETTPNFEASGLQIPIPFSDISGHEIKYKTTDNSTWQTVTNDQVIKTANDGLSGISKFSLGLGPNEYLTEVEVYYGDVDKGKVITVNAANALIGTGFVGKLNKGSGPATVTLETYTKDAHGNIVPTSLTTDDSIVVEDTVTKIFPSVSGNVKTLTAGTRMNQILAIRQSGYYYEMQNNMTQFKNFTVYHKLPDYLDIDLSTITAKNMAGDLTDKLTVSEYVLNSTGEKVVKIEVDSTIDLNNWLDGGPATPYTYIQFDYIVGNSAKGSFNYEDNLFLASTNDDDLQIWTGNVREKNVLDLNNDGKVNKDIATAINSLVSVIRKNQLVIDSYIVPDGEQKQRPYVPSNPNSAVGFTPGTVGEYTIEMLNNLEAQNVLDVEAYIPVPKAGNNFGEKFQSDEFAWDMKLSGTPDLKIYDKDGNDITSTKISNYNIEYTNEATNETNYKSSNYGSGYINDATMIKVTNSSGNMEPGEKFVIKLKYLVDEVAGSPQTMARLGKINDFMPYYFYDAGNAGWDSGTRVGTRLEIGKISGIAFEDKNYNGIYDSGDQILNNKNVDLYKKVGASYTKIKTIQSNSIGEYAFEGLSNGSYYVDFNSLLPAGYEFTKKGVGSDKSINSHAEYIGVDRGKTTILDPTKPSSVTINVGIVKYKSTDLKVEINDPSISVANNQGVNVDYLITPSIFDNVKENITWTSSNPLIVAVSTEGYVKGLSVGTSTIKVEIEDIYGNKSSDTVVVTVRSNTVPVLTLKQASANVEINSLVNLADYIDTVSDVEDAGLSASDVVIAPAMLDTSVLGSTHTIEYSVTDSDSNVTKATLTVKVVDTKKPSITANNTATWNNSTPKTEADFLKEIGYKAEDNSKGTVTTTTDFSTTLTSAVQGKPGTAIVTITAKDASGNTATHAVTVTLIDDVKPTLTGAKDVTINTANTDMTAAEFLVASGATATDNDGAAPTITSDFATVITDQNTPDIVGKDVTITATDVAGNVSTVKVKVFVKDTTKPTFVSAQNVVINSGDTDMTEAEFLTASAPVATDNDKQTPTFTSDFATVITDQNTPDATGKTVTITATDKAGNKSTKTVKVTVVDTTKPVIKNHKDVTINTGDTDMTAAEFLVASGATATDNDGAAPTITSDFATVITNQNTPDATGKTVTITATDIAGNVQTVTVKVFVKDTTKPIISGQLNVSINSDSHINAAQFLTSSAASATDNDGFAPTLTSDFDAVITDQDTPDLLGKTVTITATDKAGNSSSVTVLVTIIDTTKPTISNAKDVVIESDSPITEADFITASDYTVTDNNTVAPTVTTDFTAVMVDQLTPDATGKDVTITATDAAGNVQTQIVKVTVKDTTAPVLTVAKNKVTIKEVSSLTYADLAAEINATFTDNGDMTGVDVTVIDFENVKSDTVGTYTFKLQVTDKAGNESNIQTITVKVANEYNPTNAESIDGHDFKILIDDVNDTNIKKLAEAVAHDVSVDPEVEIPLIVSHNITTVGNKQEVVFTTANGSVLKVQADVYDAGNIVLGKGSIYANNFDMNISKLTSDSVIKAAAVEAFDANGVAVNVKDIKLVSTLPTDPGFHSFTFEANGVQVTVTGHIVAHYEVVGHDLNMTVKEFNEFKTNGTLKQEIIKRAEGKVWNVDLNKFSDLVDVDYTSVELAKVAPGVYNIVLNYTIDSDLLDGSMMSFGLNKVLSKQVKLSLVDDSKPVSPGNGNNGLGNGTSNGSGNGINTGSLPSTGVSVDATPIIIGAAILVLGLFLFLTNKKNKEEEQK